jgi:hypothetical protein
MAEKLASLRKSGKNAIEDVLYTNPNPYASFPQSTINLSNSVDDYDAIKVYYKVYYQGSQYATEYATIWDIITLKQSQAINAHIICSIECVSDISGELYGYVRALRYSTPTQLIIESAIQTGGAVVHNTLLIPIKVTGLKNVNYV